MKLSESKYWIRKSCPGWTSGLKALMYTLAGAVVLAAPSAWAHVDPLGSSATGITISLTAYRNDGLTPVLTSGASVTQCETIMYEATLSWAGGSNAAFEGGTWNITTPDGVVQDVTPAPALGCIGGTTDDPALPGGRGDCDPTVLSVVSALIPYTVTAVDIAGGLVTAHSDLVDAFAHILPLDLGGVSATSPIALPVVFCDDGLFCNGVETCDPAATDGMILGQCVGGTPVQCAAPGECFSEVCDEGVDACVRLPANPGATCGVDSDLCDPDICIGIECVVNGGVAVVCDPETEECSDLLCNPGSGACEPVPANPGATCGVDSDLCDPDICIGIECVVNGGVAVICDDEVCQSCVPGTGECADDDPLPDVCIDDERCRTPGFWGARGGIEKAPRSQNITQAVIDQAIFENGLGLPVCGIYIDNTDLLSSFSAIEAICVSVKGVTERQLVRQLTAAALNCVLGDCNAEHTAMLADCNNVCDTGVGDMQACIGALDCFNNGGDWDGSMCTTGAGFCAIGGEPCDDDNTCVGLGDSCLPDDTCHDRDLCPDFDDDGDINGSDFCFEPPGPASSPKKCNAARKNDVYVP